MYNKEIISADSLDCLVSLLTAIDISVPRRTSGRTTDHTERYSICRLLSTLAKTEYLSYPLSLVKRERPDFLLTCNSQNIGIEITEATSKDYCSYQALVEHRNPGHFIEPTHFRHGKELTQEHKQKLLQQDKLTGVPWCGDAAEKEWSLYIKEAIENKSKKLNEQSFEKFHQNWLLIYDSTPTSFLEKELLIPYLGDLFQTYSSLCFDIVFIESSWFENASGFSTSKIIVLSNKEPKFLSIENLWKKVAMIKEQ